MKEYIEEEREKKKKKTKVEKRVSYTYLLLPIQIPKYQTSKAAKFKIYNMIREDQRNKDNDFDFGFKFSVRFPSKCEKRLFNLTLNHFVVVFFALFCLICVLFQWNNKYTYI